MGMRCGFEKERIREKNMTKSSSQYILTLARLAVCGVILGSGITLRLVDGQTTANTFERLAKLEVGLGDEKMQQEIMRVKLDAISSKQDTMEGLGIGAASILGIISTIQLLLMRKRES